MKNSQSGFTLIEVLLVMVIISIIIYAGVNYVQQQAQSNRIARTSAQMQQILNAGLAYYVDNGKWPTQMSDLQTKYLPAIAITNSWGQPYNIYSYPVNTTDPRLFYVYTEITTAEPTSATGSAVANAIAGLLPLSYVSSDSGTPPDPAVGCTTGNCNVVAMVNIPGQNLNNANAVNFAGIYHHGACVPVPSCPVDATNTLMTPQIMVVPVSVSGLNDSSGSTTSMNVYPISSFTAYARGNGDPPTDKSPPSCDNSTINLDCSASAVNDANAAAYWRVCLQVVTEKGDVQVPTRSDTWGQYVTLMAVTRCAPNNEAAGSTFDAFNSTN